MSIVDKILTEAFAFNEHIVNLFQGDSEKKRLYVDAVWDMIHNSYSKIGSGGGSIKGSGFDSKEDMINDIPMWKVAVKNGKPVAVVMYKDNNGRKGIAVGSDGSREGMLTARRFVDDDFTRGRSYGEVSGPTLVMMVKRHPNFAKMCIPKSEVSKIINKSIQEVPSDDPYVEKYPELINFMYQREIGGDWITKILVGQPGNNITK